LERNAVKMIACVRCVGTSMNLGGLPSATDNGRVGFVEGMYQ